MGAKGTPGTMNKEYQEATNEYLKVFIPLSSFFLFWGSERLGEGKGNERGGRGEDGKGDKGRLTKTEPKLRSHLRYLVRRVCG